MAKGENSLIECLRYDGVPDPWKYIRYFSLRNHTQTPVTQKPITEMIYIHSKAFIVDDRYFVIGSANINDRSMLGSRDHEIGIVYCMEKNNKKPKTNIDPQNDAESQIDITIAGKPRKVSKLAHVFRT